MKTLYDYFDDSIDYPIDYMMDSESIIEVGTIYNYVGSTFLNALINNVNIEKAYVLNRYDPFDEPSQKDSKLHVDLRDHKWQWEKKIFESKKSLYDTLDSGQYEMYHTQLSCFGDDVVIVGTTNNYIWFFWFDADVSDCSIGRIKKDDSNLEKFMQSVLEFIKNVSKLGDPFEFKKDWIKGWVSY